MAAEKPKIKMKLRKADTSRLKTDTGRHRVDGEGAEGSGISVAPKSIQPAQPVADDAPTAQINDPMTLRETSHNKLKRIQTNEAAAAMTPSGSEVEGKNETVRLKVVRGPAPPSASAPAPASSRTVKISPAQPAGTSPEPSPPQVNLKRSTATLKRDDGVAGESEEHAGGTVRVAPPGQTQAASGAPGYGNTATASLKLRLKDQKQASETAEAQPPSAADEAPTQAAIKTGSDKNATSTLRIRPSQPSAPPAEGPVKRPSSATLKIRPAASKDGDAVETVDGDKNATATLKIRPGKPAATANAPGSSQGTIKISPKKVGAQAVSESTVKIKPPVEESAADDESEAAQAGKKSLRLRKPGGGKAQDSTVSLPGIPAPGEAQAAAAPPDDEGEDNPSATVAVSPPGETETAGRKKGLKLKSHGKAGETQAAPAPEGEEESDESAAAVAVAASTAAPAESSTFAGICAIAATLAIGALVTQLTLNLLQQVLK